MLFPFGEKHSPEVQNIHNLIQKRINRNTIMLVGVVGTTPLGLIDPIKELSDIYVSTDDEKIIQICEKLKVNVSYKRPKSLSSDTTSSNDVALHFLNW